jgi:excisionase family DNA binding protein
MTTQPLLTPKEVGHRFGVTSRTVHNWIESGHLRAIRIGGTVRIPPDEVARVERSEECEIREMRR